jgi:serine/threonine protein phosphatase PrpC
VTPDLLGMGTTIVMAIVTVESLTFVNVGDSRGYLIDASGLHQITHDDVPSSRSSTSRRSGATTQALGGCQREQRLFLTYIGVSLQEGDGA